jgi:hypothetical protein
VPTADIIAGVKGDDLDDEAFMLLPSNTALEHYAAKKRRAYGKALNATEASAIQIPEQLRLKNNKP